MSDTARTLNLPSRHLREELIIVKATQSKPQVVIGLKRRAGALNAIDLGTPRVHATGVKVRQRSFKQAFIATMPNGHKGVFRRRNSSRLPINEMHVVFTAKMRNAMASLSDGPLVRQLNTQLARERRFLSKRY